MLFGLSSFGSQSIVLAVGFSLQFHGAKLRPEFASYTKQHKKPPIAHLQLPVLYKETYIVIKE
jgi:hypothetical protein